VQPERVEVAGFDPTLVCLHLQAGHERALAVRTDEADPALLVARVLHSEGGLFTHFSLDPLHIQLFGGDLHLLAQPDFVYVPERADAQALPDLFIDRHVFSQQYFFREGVSLENTYELFGLVDADALVAELVVVAPNESLDPGFVGDAEAQVDAAVEYFVVARGEDDAHVVVDLGGVGLEDQGLREGRHVLLGDLEVGFALQHGPLEPLDHEGVGQRHADPAHDVVVLGRVDLLEHREILVLQLVEHLEGVGQLLVGRAHHAHCEHVHGVLVLLVAVLEHFRAVERLQVFAQLHHDLRILQLAPQGHHFFRHVERGFVVDCDEHALERRGVPQLGEQHLVRVLLPLFAQVLVVFLAFV